MADSSLPSTYNPESISLHKEASLQFALTVEQKECVCQAFTLLVRLAQQAYSRRPQDGNSNWTSVLPQLHAEKNNQVILLDGRRGSGKTTTLLSLVSFLKYQYGVQIAIDAQTSADTSLYEQILTQMKAQSLRSVIPIGIIHLSPIPQNANLFVYLASQFNTVIQLLEEQHSSSLLGMYPPKLQSPERWKDFMAIAGSAWDGNLEERRSQLDADSYAMELEVTEGRRMRFRESFYRLIDALCTDAEPSAKGPMPLWVIPIDDADMNPHLTKQLLYLLRILWHPRVVYLLTGDGHLFRQLLRTHVFSDMADPLRGFAQLNGEHNTSDISRFSRKLAQDIYGKIIPPSHHCKIRDIDSISRLEKMANSLRKITFTIDPELPMLKDHEPGRIPINRVFEVVDQTRMALPGRMRTIDNLIAEINGYDKIGATGSRGRVDPLRKFTTERWRYFLDREFDSVERSRYEHVFPSSPNNELTVNHRSHFSIRLVREDKVSPFQQEDFVFGEYAGFAGYYETKKTREDRIQGKISNREYLINKSVRDDILGTLLLAISVFPFTLLYDGRPSGEFGIGDWRGKLSVESSNSAFVRTWYNPWQLSDDVFKSARDLVWLGLPIPDWESPFLWMLLNKFWRAAYSRCTDQRSTIMNFYWCVCQVGKIKAADLATQGIDSIMAALPAPTDLQAVLNDVKAAADGKRELRPQRVLDFRNWASGLAALAASPESKCEKSLAEEILDALVPASDTRRIKLLHESRRLRIKCALSEAGLDKETAINATDIFIAQIDEGAESSGHPWVSRISKLAPAPKLPVP